VKYGLYLPNYGVFGETRRLSELAREAETSGWDGFFLWDHIALPAAEHPNTHVVDPWVALAAIALTTERIRIGTTVTPLPRRRPWKLARETVSVDRLSGGRLILGVGIGLGQAEWDNLGEEADAAKRGQMLDEGLEILTGLWSGQPFHYDGRHYHVKDTCFAPTPIQEPRIPIWVGGLWPNKAPFRRMAHWDGMFPLFNVYGPEQIPLFLEAVTSVQAQRQAAGVNTPFDIIKLGVTPGDNPVEAAAAVRPAEEAGATWWLEVLMPEVYGFAVTDEQALEPIRRRIQQGPPQI
jgi:probable F420-dependent oxidoreductase